MKAVRWAGFTHDRLLPLSCMGLRPPVCGTTEEFDDEEVAHMDDMRRGRADKAKTGEVHAGRPTF